MYLYFKRHFKKPKFHSPSDAKRLALSAARFVRKRVRIVPFAQSLNKYENKTIRYRFKLIKNTKYIYINLNFCLRLSFKIKFTFINSR